MLSNYYEIVKYKLFLLSWKLKTVYEVVKSVWKTSHPYGYQWTFHTLAVITKRNREGLEFFWEEPVYEKTDEVIEEMKRAEELLHRLHEDDFRENYDRWHIHYGDKRPWDEQWVPVPNEPGFSQFEPDYLEGGDEKLKEAFELDLAEKKQVKEEVTNLIFRQSDKWCD